MRFRKIADFLTKCEIWVVVALIGLSMLWSPLLPAAAFAAMFFWLARWVSQHRLSKPTPADLATGILVVTIPVSLWVTVQPETTLYQSYRLLAGIALYYAIVNWCDNSKKVNLICLGIAAIGIILASIAPLSVQWSFGKLPFLPVAFYERFAVVVSDIVHPNVLAGSLVLLIPITIAGCFFPWRELRWLERILLSVSSLGMLGVLALTQSRGALLAIFVSLLLLVLLRWKWGWVGLLIAFGLAVIAIQQIGVSQLLDLLVSGSTIKGFTQREEIWSRAIWIIHDFPFTGIGMGSFLKVADQLYPFFLSAPGTIQHTHNLFLQIGVDLGLIGLVAWTSIFILVSMAARRLYTWGRAHHEMRLAGLGVGLLCSQAALIVHGLTDAVVWGMVRPAPLIWGIWGLAVAAYILSNHRVNIPGAPSA